MKAGGSGDDAAVMIRADIRRATLRVPLFLLAASVAVCASILALGAVRAEAGSLRIGTVCALGFAYLRWVYAARTMLIVDAEGVVFRQPHSRWRVGWREVARVSETDFLTPAHRGGVAAGVRLTMQAGGHRNLPNVLRLPRADLARLLAAKSKAAPPAAG